MNKNELNAHLRERMKYAGILLLIGVLIHIVVIVLLLLGIDVYIPNSYQWLRVFSNQ